MEMTYLEVMGIELLHVVVSCSKVFWASRETGYNFISDDSKLLTPEQMVDLILEELKALENYGVEDPKKYFEEYYELTYRGITKKYSVQEYFALVELFHLHNKKLMNAIFK